MLLKTLKKVYFKMKVHQSQLKASHFCAIMYMFALLYMERCLVTFAALPVHRTRY